MTDAKSPDVMKKLVMFIIAIAILGTIIALAVHYGVELPARKTVQVPVNAVNPNLAGFPQLTPGCDELWPGRCSGLPNPG